MSLAAVVAVIVPSWVWVQWLRPGRAWVWWPAVSAASRVVQLAVRGQGWGGRLVGQPAAGAYLVAQLNHGTAVMTCVPLVGHDDTHRPCGTLPPAVVLAQLVAHTHRDTAVGDWEIRYK